MKTMLLLLSLLNTFFSLANAICTTKYISAIKSVEEELSVREKDEAFLGKLSRDGGPAIPLLGMTSAVPVIDAIAAAKLIPALSASGSPLITVWGAATLASFAYANYKISTHSIKRSRIKRYEVFTHLI